VTAKPKKPTLESIIDPSAVPLRYRLSRPPMLQHHPDAVILEIDIQFFPASMSDPMTSWDASQWDDYKQLSFDHLWMPAKSDMSPNTSQPSRRTG
jgi:hypothetical protein